jgi:hypothetical protein
MRSKADIAAAKLPQEARMARSPRAIASSATISLCTHYQRRNTLESTTQHFGATIGGVKFVGIKE